MKKKTVYIVLISLMAILILAIVLWGFRTASQQESLVPNGTPAVASKPKADRPELLQIRQETTTETIREGLQDIGKLATEEYYFTEVVNYSSVKTLWNINLGFTNSNFLISYDGVVTAGIDLTDAKIDMREDTKRIYVLLPEAEIMSVEIDFNSFQKYSEREGIGNRITLENYNDALKSIDETARQKAVDKGILNRAYENARVIVQRMIGSLVDLNEYSLEIGREYP
ncbi:MAG: DUF4230 domain-containing protein [Oscillospiraceae bacterium]|nr:DUF4230 domain-containing protein [Oscillospiraceae bacterium]